MSKYLWLGVLFISAFFPISAAPQVTLVDRNAQDPNQVLAIYSPGTASCGTWLEARAADQSRDVRVNQLR